MIDVVQVEHGVQADRKGAARRPIAIPKGSKSVRLNSRAANTGPVTFRLSAAAADALELSIQQSIFLVNCVISLAVCRLRVIDPFAI